MRPKLLLRIAAVIMLLHTAGHSVGALTWTQAPNVRVAAVIAGMQRERFDFMGRSSTIAMLYNGYGIIMIFVLLLVSILLWLLSGNPVKSMILALGLFLLLTAISEFIYFFPLAADMTFLASVSTLFSLRRRSTTV